MTIETLTGEWWVWIGAAILLGALEIVIPGYIFLGFAIGAAVVGGLIAVGAPIGGSLAISMLIFAVISLIAWIVLRQMLGIREGQVKHIHHDINED